jgi:NADH:ubiquinone oxidoreductase subunit 2 (subunit N)
MFFKESAADVELTEDVTPAFKILLVITAVAIIALGLFPSLIIDWLYF